MKPVVSRTLRLGLTGLILVMLVLFARKVNWHDTWRTMQSASLGQRTVGWSLGVWDSARPGADVIAARTLEGMHAGSILLLHDGDGYDPEGDRSQTAEALPAILDGLRRRGFRFTTLPD